MELKKMTQKQLDNYLNEELTMSKGLFIDIVSSYCCCTDKIDFDNLEESLKLRARILNSLEKSLIDFGLKTNLKNYNC
jgi:hydrogenase maturation factor HypF (carbamoyltransferase family)